MNESDRVLVEILVAAPIDVVWRALSEPAEITRWFGWEYPGLAEEAEGMFKDRAKVSEGNYTLQFAMMGDRYTLESHGAHTIVRLIRSAPVTDKGWKGIYDDTVEGWLTFTQQLRFALERHLGEDRRTLYLNGRAKASVTALPIDALGLRSLIVVPIGERYSVTTPMGDALEGEVWFRSANQIGLTVDKYGDGLLVVGTRPRTSKSPHGSGESVVTTYNLDEATFGALRDRWSAWWRQTYEVIDIQP
jgi:hypothetical protein